MFIVEHKTTKEEKFGVLYQLYIKDIYKVCLHLTMNEEQAQEIAKQTFVNFYEHFENVSSDCVFAYLVNTAKVFAYSYQKNDILEAKEAI